jgi:hypothetical protein
MAASSDKCARLARQLEALQTKGDISDQDLLPRTGSRPTNALVKYLECEARATGSCSAAVRDYQRCHKAIMGTGLFNGERRHCSPELSALRTCLGLDS